VVVVGGQWSVVDVVSLWLWWWKVAVDGGGEYAEHAASMLHGHHENPPVSKLKRECVPSRLSSADHQHNVLGNIDANARGYAACELGYVPRRFLVG
jgi:hypothetical protein